MKTHSRPLDPGEISATVNPNSGTRISVRIDKPAGESLARWLLKHPNTPLLDSAAVEAGKRLHAALEASLNTPSS